jgi:paraquat-inducible protein B
MTQHDVEEAVVEEKRRFSIVWVIPIVAALVGAFVAYKAFSSRGPEITITFKTAEGLEAGKTKIKYKDVEVGVVETVELANDLSGIICHARMVPGADAWLHEKTQFWVVRPRISGGQVSGLETLLAGAYIGVDPSLEGKNARKFAGLNVAPIVTLTEPGRYYVLRSEKAGAIDVGSPVYFQHIAVGKVVSSELAAEGDVVTTRVFVQAPYDIRVHTNSRFWNASGIDMKIGADGLSIDTQSLISILIGGLAFDTPDTGGATEVAAADAEFPLFENREASLRRHFARTTPYVLHFDQTVRGLSVGAPVEFRGIQIGEVTDIELDFDTKSDRGFHIPVTIEIEPERFLKGRNITEEQRRDVVDRMVAHGLRAQLRSGNLLTGQLFVALDLFPDASPAKVDWSGQVAELPTVPASIQEITQNLTRLADRLGKVPVEQIGADLKASLASLSVTLKRSEDTGPQLKATLEAVQRTLANTDALIGPDSTVNNELRRTLLELSEAARALGRAANQFESQPDSVIFVKKGQE